MMKVFTLIFVSLLSCAEIYGTEVAFTLPVSAVVTSSDNSGKTWKQNGYLPVTYAAALKQMSSALSIPDDGELEASIIRRETVGAILTAADRILSDYEREVLALHMQGYKTRAIADKLSRTAKSVDNAKSRIFRRLRAVIENEY